MTEADWLVCTDPVRMVEYLSFRGNATVRANVRNKRKLRLFAVACCYGVSKWMPDERSRRGVETAEKLADGLVGEHELQVARNDAGEANDLFVGKSAHFSEAARAGWYVLKEPEFMWVGDVIRSAFECSASELVHGYQFFIDTGSEEVREATLRENSRQVCLLRDIFGNPFHPPGIDISWLSWNGGMIRTLAQSIYDERAFDRLPDLADALDEAGCTNLDFQAQCRQPGPHVRGCWPVDLLLGKE